MPGLVAARSVSSRNLETRQILERGLYTRDFLRRHCFEVRSYHRQSIIIATGINEPLARNRARREIKLHFVRLNLVENSRELFDVINVYGREHQLNGKLSGEFLPELFDPFDDSMKR